MTQIHPNTLKNLNPKAMLGKKHSEETKRKMSLAHKGNTNGFAKGHKINLGKYHTKETKEKISKVIRGRKQSITERAMRSKAAARGLKHHSWRGGKTKIYTYKHTSSFRYKRWREQVFERDNWTCQNCKQRCEKGKSIYLEAHHLKTWTEYPKLRFVVSNGQTLCKKCHNLTKQGRRKIA